MFVKGITCRFYCSSDGERKKDETFGLDKFPKYNFGLHLLFDLINLFNIIIPFNKSFYLLLKHLLPLTYLFYLDVFTQ